VTEKEEIDQHFYAKFNSIVANTKILKFICDPSHSLTFTTTPRIFFLNFALDKLQDPAKAPEMASKRENSCVYKDFIGQIKKNIESVETTYCF
jgi:hypothetical protein